MPDPITSGPFVSYDIDPASNTCNVTVAWGADKATHIGRLAMNTMSPLDPPVDFFDDSDYPNQTNDHMVTVFGLALNTKYVYQLSCIDVDPATGETVVAQSGMLDYTTPASAPGPTDVCLVYPRCRPILLRNGGIARVSVEAVKDGQGVAGVPVDFELVKGKGELRSGTTAGQKVQATSDASGQAAVNLKALAKRQILVVKIYSAQAKNHTFAFAIVLRW